jgi:hypothetical protein
MKTKVIRFVYILLVCLNVACQQAQNKQLNKENLTVVEQALIDSTEFDAWVIEDIKKQLPHVTFSKFRNEIEVSGAKHDSLAKKAISFNVGVDTTESVMGLLGDLFLKNGYLIFRSKTQFGLGNVPDELTIVKTNNQFDALVLIGTNNYNYGGDEEWVYNYALSINKRFPYRILGAEFDNFEAKFITPPTDWLAFAKEIYEDCPDIVIQGSGTVEDLAEEMKQTNRLYLWWD